MRFVSPRASEVPFHFKSGQPVANSGPGVRAGRTASATSGRKSEAGPPSSQISTEGAHLTLKVGRMGDFKGGRWNLPPLRARDARALAVLQACLIACNMRQFDALVAGGRPQ